MNRNDNSQVLEQAWEAGPADYIQTVTDGYLDVLGGTLTADNMDTLTPQQHTLLAYRYLLDEVMEGGFIQLIQNGYGPYVLEGPFARIIKKEWGMTEFGKFLYKVRKEYLLHREALEAELDDEQFMALYEQQESMNELGDDFLDDYQEEITPAIAQYVRTHEQDFIIPTQQ